MNEGAAADQAHARLQAILKAVVVGQDVSDPASREAGESSTLFSSAGAIEPPYDPAALCLLVEHSNALRRNLDAYAHCDGFGHRLEPAIDFEAEDADARVADAIFLERSAARERGELRDLQRLAVLCMAWWTSIDPSAGIRAALTEWQRFTSSSAPVTGDY